MCLPCWPITKTTHERGSNQRSNPQRYHWHWSRTRNMWILRDTFKTRQMILNGRWPSEMGRAGRWIEKMELLGAEIISLKRKPDGYDEGTGAARQPMGAAPAPAVGLIPHKRARFDLDFPPHPQASPFTSKMKSEQDDQNGSNGARPTTPLRSMRAFPAAPPVLNPNGIHFQPQLPSTQFGPMTQTYIPRRDPPSMAYFAGPAAGFPQVTGQDTPLCQMGGYALQGGYMMGPQGPVVLSPAGVTMPAMPGAGMPAMGMFGPQGGPIPPSFPGAGIAYSRMQPGMNPLMQMPNGHCHQAFPGSPTPGAQPPHVHFEPALSIGLTQSERLAADIEHAKQEGCFEPQDFMPANRDPYKEWWVEEVDGHWGLYQRRQIDRLKHKWYVRDGWFYAKRLEAPPDV
ncbi:uncharacterized protein QC764_0113470 [Podospora pseudoanserina]|uniref:Uncharacterized protein n=1 Tax=Podospora pseudoanserina TaxID=2609844 RepID=A0ABR0HJC5_9PEZI|nr:hypothetical protein QC764_0113470 [Podospora pseudoanserina]